MAFHSRRTCWVQFCYQFFFWLGAAWVKSRAERPSVSEVNYGCSLGGHQSKVLITRPLCFGALAEAGPDASSNIRFFLSPFVSQAKYPKMSSFMREGKIQEASSALGRTRPTLMQVSKPNTSANSCDMPCCHQQQKPGAKSSEPGSFLLHGKQASTRTPCKSFPFPILLFPPANLSAQPASTRQRRGCHKAADRK